MSDRQKYAPLLALAKLFTIPYTVIDAVDDEKCNRMIPIANLGR